MWPGPISPVLESRICSIKSWYHRYLFVTCTDLRLPVSDAIKQLQNITEPPQYFIIGAVLFAFFCFIQVIGFVTCPKDILQKLCGSLICNLENSTLTFLWLGVLLGHLLCHLVGSDMNRYINLAPIYCDMHLEKLQYWKDLNANYMAHLLSPSPHSQIILDFILFD